jgi:hypothetical protein
MDANSCVKIFASFTKLVTNFRIFDVTSSKEHLLYTKLIGAFNHFVKIGIVTSFSVIFALESFVREVGSDVEKTQLTPTSS